MPRSHRYLTDHERAVLRAIADRPNLSSGQVVAIFRVRTGRELCRWTARQAQLGQLPDGPGRHHLSTTQRATLEWLLAEEGDGFNAREIAAAFEVLTGRTLYPTRIGRVARELNIEPAPVGMPRSRRPDRRRRDAEEGGAG